MDTISKGHIGFSRYNGAITEWYVWQGDLYRAPISCVIDLDRGVRFGRWEAPAHMLAGYMAQLEASGIEWVITA